MSNLIQVPRHDTRVLGAIHQIAIISNAVYCFPKLGLTGL